MHTIIFCFSFTRTRCRLTGKQRRKIDIAMLCKWKMKQNKQRKKNVEFALTQKICTDRQWHFSISKLKMNLCTECITIYFRGTLAQPCSCLDSAQLSSKPLIQCNWKEKRVCERDKYILIIITHCNCWSVL